MSADRENWGSKLGLILAVAGNAVGLGNFLRFPVQAVQNGGGAFIIPYLVCLVLMGLPLMWVEWSMGRYGGRYGYHSTPFVFSRMGGRRWMMYLGAFSLFSCVAIAAYYCYIESWTLGYTLHSLLQTFSGQDQGQVAGVFDQYVAMQPTLTGALPLEAFILYLLCLGINLWILSMGVEKGVEKVAKVGMPLLVLFGVFLAIRGVSLGTPADAPQGCTDCNATLGMAYLWQPSLDGIWRLEVWLAAAGQIFFTLGLGMGTVHCMASYMRSNQDVALSGASSSMVNTFVEVVLGASIIIPISVGYLGLDWTLQNAGFALGFKTMPYLFSQWGSLLGTLAGVMWFGMLFFAGITSSLAMGMPWLAFFEDEFGWKRVRAVLAFGGFVLLLGVPCVFLMEYGVFDEFDYWSGTVALVVFAVAEIIIFSWIFGMKKGWAEINLGAELRISPVFRFVLAYITPVLLIIVLLGSMVAPQDGWINGVQDLASGKGWPLSTSSIAGKITNRGVDRNTSWQASRFDYDLPEPATVASITATKDGGHTLAVAQHLAWHRSSAGKALRWKGSGTRPAGVYDSLTTVRTYSFGPQEQVLVQAGAALQPGQQLSQGPRWNPIVYTDLARVLLVIVFGTICGLVYAAYRRRRRLGMDIVDNPGLPHSPLE